MKNDGFAVEQIIKVQVMREAFRSMRDSAEIKAKDCKRGFIRDGIWYKEDGTSEELGL